MNTSETVLINTLIKRTQKNLRIKITFISNRWADHKSRLILLHVMLEQRRRYYLKLLSGTGQHPKLMISAHMLKRVIEMASISGISDLMHVPTKNFKLPMSGRQSDDDQSKKPIS
ncbi:hypothetical protein BVU17_17915 (plasmid) [Haloarcula taiwanensis]|uniref:Uncharacterized protein n=1 Tax=Haloarcula taiwanensis TaxID=1932004 RepID=A0A2H5A408_9EURY|nr:hypothetical protein BVU17_17915 [Haloarcula taiwanensis]